MNMLFLCVLICFDEKTVGWHVNTKCRGLPWNFGLFGPWLKREEWKLTLCCLHQTACTDVAGATGVRTSHSFSRVKASPSKARDVRSVCASRGQRAFANTSGTFSFIKSTYQKWHEMISNLFQVTAHRQEHFPFEPMTVLKLQGWNYSWPKYVIHFLISFLKTWSSKVHNKSFTSKSYLTYTFRRLKKPLNIYLNCLAKIRKKEKKKHHKVFAITVKTKHE